MAFIEEKEIKIIKRIALENRNQFADIAKDIHIWRHTHVYDRIKKEIESEERIDNLKAGCDQILAKPVRLLNKTLEKINQLLK